jgi:protein tyrosine phosphatase type IVA
MHQTITKIESPDNKIYYISGYPDNGVKYLDFLRKEGIIDVFNFCYMDNCDPYFNYSNINYYLMPFKDGGFPETNLIDKFLLECQEIFKTKDKIAVFCKSGMGRAPTMTALQMITNKMDNQEVIEHIRKKRKGCFNNLQIQGIIEYKKSNENYNCCILS